MRNIYVPSYNSLLSLVKRIRAIQDLYDYISGWKKEVDAVEAVIPAEASDTNQLADKAWVTQQGGGGDVSGKEDKVTIVSYSTAPSTISADISKYYRIDADVDTLAVTLPEVTDNTKVASVLLLITAGTTPNVTLTPTTPSGGTAPDVYYQADYAIEAGKTYEINCLWNGDAWTVVSVEIEVV